MLNFTDTSHDTSDDEFLRSENEQTTKQVQEKTTKKRRKRRKKSKAARKAEAAYHPRQNRRRVNKDFEPSARGTIQLMGASTPDAKKAAVRGTQVTFTPDTKTQILKSPDYQASTPDCITSRFLVTPQGKTKLIASRIIQIQNQEVSIYLPKEKVKTERLAVPLFPDVALEELDIPQGSLEATIDTPITLNDIRQAAKEKAKAKRDGDPVRSPTQDEIMQISARKALKAAGIVVEPRSVHWTHFVSHSMKGNKAQFLNNLGLATKFCNAEMELLNPVIKKILRSKGHPDTLYLSFYPKWVNGYEKIRLLESLSVEIKDGAGTNYKRRVKFSFDALTLNAICLSEIKIVEKILLDTFQTTTPLAAQTVLLSPQGLLSPSRAPKQRLYRPDDRALFSSPTRFNTPLHSTSNALNKVLQAKANTTPQKENTDDFSLSSSLPQLFTPLFTAEKERPKPLPLSPLRLSQKKTIPKFSLTPTK
ncbi:MAG: hypothetical protein AB7D28_03400 [Candidatus Berkiella sp.]